jgi:hypothetical protein
MAASDVERLRGRWHDALARAKGWLAAGEHV